MAKKAKKQRKSNREIKQVPHFDVKIPKGYSVVASSDFAPVYVFAKKGETIEGEILKVEHSKNKKYKKSRIANLKLKNGKVVALWSSAQLNAMFDRATEKLEADEEVHVFVTYGGEQKIKGQKNPMKLFVSGIKE